MAANTSQIGSFVFVYMSGPVPLYRREFQYQQQSGKDGHAIWDTGQRGEVFQVTTKTDLVNYATARALLEQYQQAQLDAVPLTMIWENIAEPRLVLIDAVEAINGTPKAILAGIGGTYAGTARGWLEARWRLHNLYLPA